MAGQIMVLMDTMAGFTEMSRKLASRLSTMSRALRSKSPLSRRTLSDLPPMSFGTALDRRERDGLEVSIQESCLV